MLRAKKAKEFKCSDENVRNVLVLSFVNNGANALLEIFSYFEGYSAEDDILYNPETSMGITKPCEINTFSTIYEYDEKEYLLNFINFPYNMIKDHGYMFNAADCCLIVISSTQEDVIEKYTPIIETVVENKIKPILFINKLDELIYVFEKDIESMLRRFAYIMNNVNRIIELKRGSDDWNIEIEKDNIIFGCASQGWGFNRAVRNQTGIEFKDIHEIVKKSIYNDLKEQIPLNNAVFDCVMGNSPLMSQSIEYRLPIICKEDIGASLAKSIVNADPDGPLILTFIGKRVSEVFPKAFYCRILSGTLKKGDEIHLINSKEKIKVNHTFILDGPYRLACSEIPYAKMGSVMTDKDVRFGETYVLE